MLEIQFDRPTAGAVTMRMAQITYITTCKGRLAHVKQTLPRAVAQGFPCVVVDYSCPDGAGDWVTANFPQVRVVRIDGEAGFNPSRARNAGAQVARTPWLGFFDADILIAPTFLSVVEPLLAPGNFYRAQPVTRQTWGSVVCAREDFAAIRGYDETYAGWSGEDDDLLRALLYLGRRHMGFDSALLDEIPHSNELRVKFHAVQDITLQHRINHAFMNVKFDMLRLTGRGLSMPERKTVYQQIKDAVMTAQQNGGGAPVTIQVPVPRIIIQGPPTDDGATAPEIGVMQRTLTYTLHVKRP